MKPKGHCAWPQAKNVLNMPQSPLRSLTRA